MRHKLYKIIVEFEVEALDREDAEGILKHYLNKEQYTYHSYRIIQKR